MIQRYYREKDEQIAALEAAVKGKDEEIKAWKETSQVLVKDGVKYNERIAALTEALGFILPMAKGYAADHPVGRNREIVNEAEGALKEATDEPT